MKIAIIGAGFEGLVLGHLLAPEHQITIFEKDSAVGGLLKMVEVDGVAADKYYHHLFKNDNYAIKLFKDLKIDSEIDWSKSTTSVYLKGEFRPFFKPLELLKFPYLSFLSKLRFGLAVLFLQNYRRGEKLKDLNAAGWIKRYMGEEVWRVVWQPLFSGKFDRFAEQISLSWFWARIFSKRGGRPGGDELLGYPKGGFGGLLDKLVESIEASGGKILLNQAVTAVEIENKKVALVKTETGEPAFDLIISTVAPAILAGLLKGADGEFVNQLKTAEYLGAISTILLLKDGLAPAYWNNILEPSIPFKGIIEQTKISAPDAFGGRHLVYLSHYTPRDSKYYLSSDRDLLDFYRPHLLKIDSAFSSKLIGYGVFRDGYCQPVIKTGYAQSLINFKTPIGGLYQLSMAQIFPFDRGLNAAVKAAGELAGIIGAGEGINDKKVWNERMYEAHPTRRAYEHNNFLVRFIEGRRLKEIVSLAAVKSEDKVIEVGCEAGYLLKRLLGAGEVVGLDIAQNALDDAARMIKFPKLKLICADAAAMPLTDNYFDKVICSETLEHVAEPEKIIAELKRVAKPGGLIIISVPYEKILASAKALLVKLRLFDAWFSGIENKSSDWHLQNFNKKEIVDLCRKYFKVESAKLTPFPFLGPRIILKCRKEI